jgi:hypothetical protein
VYPEPAINSNDCRLCSLIDIFGGEEMQDITELKDIGTMAKILSIPVSRLYSETRRKGPDTIPLVRIGKYCRFHVPSVIAYFQKQTEAGRE